jgi:hypothetical protein
MAEKVPTAPGLNGNGFQWFIIQQVEYEANVSCCTINLGLASRYRVLHNSHFHNLHRARRLHDKISTFLLAFSMAEIHLYCIRIDQWPDMTAGSAVADPQLIISGNQFRFYCFILPPSQAPSVAA